MTLRTRIVAEARSWIGTPYQHGQSRRGLGCDCLGLVRGVWRDVVGAEPEAAPAYSPDWAEAGGRETMLEAARRHLRERPVLAALPGDVLLFRWRPHLPAKHCAILVEPATTPGTAGRIVHAYDAAGFVAEGSLAGWRDRVVAAFSLPGVDAEDAG